MQPQNYAFLGAPQNLDNYIVPQTIWTDSARLHKIRGRHSIGFGFMDVWAASTAATSANTTLESRLPPRAPIPNRRRQDRQTVSLPSWSCREREGSNGFQQFPGPPINTFSAGYVQDTWENDKQAHPHSRACAMKSRPLRREMAQRAGVFNLPPPPISSSVGFNVRG